MDSAGDGQVEPSGLTRSEASVLGDAVTLSNTVKLDPQHGVSDSALVEVERKRPRPQSLKRRFSWVDEEVVTEALANSFVSTSSLLKFKAGPSENMILLCLMNTVNHITSKSRKLFGRQASMHPAGDPGERLYKIIRRVLKERKVQLVHEKLLALIQERRIQEAKCFELPESISTPRTVLDVQARMAWWWSARKHPSKKQKNAIPHDSSVVQAHDDNPSSGLSSHNMLKSTMTRSKTLRNMARSMPSLPTASTGSAAQFARREVVSRADRSGIATDRRERVNPEYEVQRLRLKALAKLEGAPTPSCSLPDPRSLVAERRRLDIGPTVTVSKRRASVLKNAEHWLTCQKVTADRAAEHDDADTQLPCGDDIYGKYEGTSSENDDTVDGTRPASPCEFSQPIGNVRSESGALREADFVDMVIDAAGGVLPVSAPGSLFPNQKDQVERKKQAKLEKQHRAILPTGQISRSRKADEIQSRVTTNPILNRTNAAHASTPVSLAHPARQLPAPAASINEEMPIRRGKPRLNTFHMGEGGASPVAIAPPQRAVPTWGTHLDKAPAQSWSAHLEREALQVPTCSTKHRQRVSASVQGLLDRHIDDKLDRRTRRVRAIVHEKGKPADGGTFCSSASTPNLKPEAVPRPRSSPATNVPRWASDEAADKQSRRREGWKEPVPERSVKLQPPVRAATLNPVAAAYMDELSNSFQFATVPKCLQAYQGPPRMPDLEQNEDDMGSIDVDMHDLNLADYHARPLLEGLNAHDVPFKSLRLSGNPRLSDDMHSLFLELICHRAAATGGKIQFLDVSGSSGFGDKSFVFLTRELRTSLRDLQVLRLDGITIAESGWPQFESSMQSLMELKELSLADMNIGRASQRGACTVAELLGTGVPKLTCLDISHNFFSYRGCEALASNLALHPKLEKLDMSYSAGFVDTKGPPYSPLALICEAIIHAQSLTSLSLAHCQLTYDEDFILEDALSQKSLIYKSLVSLKELDLTGNRLQGRSGTRCLVRMLANTSTMTTLRIIELDESLPTSSSIPYEYTDPSAQYSLNLSHPQHRAFLRTLLRRCKQFRKKPEEVVQFIQSEMGRRILADWSSRQDVPIDGEISLVYQSPEEENNEDINEHLKRICLSRKLRMSLWSFIRLSNLYREMMNSASRRVLIGAMASDFSINLAHVKYMSELESSMSVEVIEALLPAVVSNLDRFGGYDLVSKARISLLGPNSPPIYKSCVETLRLILFNACAPQTHYELDLVIPADRRIMELIILINAWDVNRATKRGHPDLSQHGGHECLRNCRLNGSEVVWKNADFTIPNRGELTFEYCTPFHVTSGSAPTSNVVLEDVIEAIEEAPIDALTKVAVLRTVVHTFRLKAEQCAELLAAFPPFEEISFGRPPRVEAFVTLYPFCMDICELLSSEKWGLYGLTMMSRLEVFMVRDRLGRFRTWNITRLDDEQITPGERSQDRRQQQEDAERDASRFKQTLMDNNLRDDPTSLGNANRYVFNLAVYEDWQCFRAMMAVAAKEPGEHYDEPKWSEKAHLEARGSQWLVPQEWQTELPEVGIVTVRYFLERPNYVDAEARKAIAEKFLAW